MTSKYVQDYLASCKGGVVFPDDGEITEPYQLELMKNPIRYWGRKWQEWMKIEYPNVVYMMQDYNHAWEIVPREIDIMADKRFDELTEIFDKTNQPRPTTFWETAAWEKEKQLFVQNGIMNDVVFKLYDVNKL